MKESTISTIFGIALVVLYLIFRAWQADGNTRCFFAQDPSTCATVLNK